MITLSKPVVSWFKGPSYLLLFMPGSFGCFRTGNRFTVGTVYELQEVLHPPVVLHPSISFYRWLLLLTFWLFFLALCQTQAQFLPHLCIISTGWGSWWLYAKQGSVKMNVSFLKERYICIYNYSFSKRDSNFRWAWFHQWVLPLHGQRIHSSSSHSTFLLSGWLRWRWTSCAQNSCPHPDSPLRHMPDAHMTHFLHSDGLHSRDHW